jgi:hypothetical protein
MDLCHGGACWIPVLMCIMLISLCYLLHTGLSYIFCGIVFAHESDKSRKPLFETGKSDYPILSISTAVRGAVSTRRESFFSDQTTSGWKIGKNHDNLGGWAADTRSNQQKERKVEN